VLYLAEDHNTCLNEILVFGWPPVSTAIIPVQFDLKAVVDLQDHRVRAILQLTQAELEFNFRSLPSGSAPALTQLLGERCVASRRVDGLLYESQTVAGKKSFGSSGGRPCRSGVGTYGQRPCQRAKRQVAIEPRVPRSR